MMPWAVICLQICQTSNPWWPERLRGLVLQAMTLYKNQQHLLGILDCLQHIKLFPYLFDSANQWNSNRIANDISPILYYFWPSTVEEGRRIKADIQQHLQYLKNDEKVVKQITGDGPKPSAKHTNDTALRTLVLHAPHGVSNKVMDYMYNRFNIVLIIFEETRAKRCSEGDNITLDK
uniref:Uncharacterized protein n=1 Tax=Romanomermis culicivorax TaxID=13658 RepID=A0A915J717_ROMCU